MKHNIRIKNKIDSVRIPIWEAIKQTKMSANQKIPVAHAQELLSHIETSREAMNIQSQKVVAHFLENLDTIDQEALDIIVALMKIDLELEETDDKIVQEIIKNMEQEEKIEGETILVENMEDECVAHPDYYCDGGCGLVVDESKRKCGDC